MTMWTREMCIRSDVSRAVKTIETQCFGRWMEGESISSGKDQEKFNKEEDI